MSKYPFFSVIGVEIEYMLVDIDTLEIMPKSDLILKEIAGNYTNEVSLGEISISNELVMHVIELKNTTPKPPAKSVAKAFQDTIITLEPLLTKHNLQLLPTGTHPWMNPKTQTKRWTHESREIYDKYHEIFNCNNHGWSNLQSIHINLPFNDDTEFAKLHNAIRIILPLLPALAASSPFLESKKTDFLDTRLAMYAQNQNKISSITKDVIPEFITSKSEYIKDILQPMFDEIKPYDPDNILQEEWLNSRASIAKFEQMAIEIRILDTQECVNADMALVYLVYFLLKDLVNSSEEYLIKPISTKFLKNLYDQSIRYGFATNIDNFAYLKQLKLPTKSMQLHALWSLLIERVSSNLDNESQKALENILINGNLSERILKKYKKNEDYKQLKNIYHELGNCLFNNQIFMK